MKSMLKKTSPFIISILLLNNLNAQNINYNDSIKNVNDKYDFILATLKLYENSDSTFNAQELLNNEAKKYRNEIIKSQADSSVIKSSEQKLKYMKEFCQNVYDITTEKVSIDAYEWFANDNRKTETNRFKRLLARNERIKSRNR